MQAEVSRRHVGRADAESDAHIVQLEEPFGHCLRVRGGHMEESLVEALTMSMEGRRCKEKKTMRKTNSTHTHRSQKKYQSSHDVILHHHHTLPLNNLSGPDMGVIGEQLHLDTDQRGDPKDRGQQMRPGVDEIIVQVKERPEAGGERVELASIAVPYVRVDLHPGWYFIPVEDALGRCIRAGFCPRTRF